MLRRPYEDKAASVLACAAIAGFLSLAKPADADWSYSESSAFSVNVLSLPTDNTSAASESAIFSLDLTRMNRASADSGTFTIGGPTPYLRVVQQTTGQSGVVQEWQTAVIDGVQYRWKIRTADATPVGIVPLSAYRGTILGVGAEDAAAQPITNLDELRSAFIATENAASLSQSTFTGNEESIPLSFVAAGITTTDDQGSLYHIDQSLVSDSTGSAGEFLEFNTVSGFGDRATRRELWKQIAMEAALQNAVFARMEAGENGAEGHRQNLYKYAEMVVKHAGQAESASKLLSKLKKFGDLGLSQVDFTEIVQEFQLVANDLSELQLRIDVNKQVDIRRTQQLRDSFSTLFAAFSVAGTVANYTGEVAEALMLQAVARAQGEERILVLHELALASVFSDPAAFEGITEAVAEYDNVKNSFSEAWSYIRSSDTPLQTVGEITDLIRAGMNAGTLFNGLFPQTAGVIAQKIPLLASNGTKVLGRCLGAAGSALNIALSIDSTLKTMRQADLALTMERAIKGYLENQHALGGSFESEDVQRLLMADQMRYYLQYWHFEKCLNILKAEWYDFYRIIMLDPIGGLIWLQGILNSQSRDEAVAVYEVARLGGIQNAIRTLDARGRVSPGLWNQLDDLLAAGVGVVQYEVPIAVDLSAGVPQWVYFETINYGAEPDQTFISVSVPAGITAIDSSLDGLTGTWTTYPIGGTPIYHKNGSTFPPIDTLYEYSGPFPEQSSHRPGLLLQAAADGTYWIRARVAMLPTGADPMNNAAYARYPGSGPLDQQGWESLQIDATSGVVPCPNLIVSPTGPVQVLVGEAVEIELSLTNAGGCAPATRTFVDLSHDSGLQVETIAPLSEWTRYEPSELIWNSTGQQFPALKTLWSQENTRTGSPETRVTTLRVRPTSPGTWAVYVRSSLRSAGMPVGDYVRSPSSGPVDQQGWPVQTIVVSATANQAPVITATNPPDAVIIGTATESLSFLVAAYDPDLAPETLSYAWSLDGSQGIGTGASIQFDLSTLPIGEHTVSVLVSDGLANRRAEWRVNVVSTATLVAEVMSDVGSQFANIPSDDDLFQVAYTVNISDSGGNTSFLYSWSSPVNPGSGRSMALVSGAGPLDSTASFATPVVPPETTEPYVVSCVITGEQTGAAVLASSGVQVLPAAPVAGDLDCTWFVTIDDVEPFVLALIDPTAYAAVYPTCSTVLADLNGDGFEDGFDIQAFVNLLTSP